MSQPRLHKPDANFAFKPANSLSSQKSPTFNTLPKTDPAHRVFASLNENEMNERTPAAAGDGAGPFGANKPKPKAADDDIDIDELISGFASLKHGVQVQAASSMNKILSKHGHGSHPKMMSSLKQKANVFIQQKSRPEHHLPTRMNVPRAPTYQHRLPPPMPVFSSNQVHAEPLHARDEVFYTDPNKASADLKALLEGGMEEEEEEEPEPEPVPEKEAPQVAKVTGAPTTKPHETNEETKATLQKKTVRRKKIPRDGKIENLAVQLLPHQVVGVEWMRGRELGPVRKGIVPKGGLLADDMGLGKTLQTISLILLNQKPEKDSEQWTKSMEKVEKTTLVVAPLALIRQWEQEIKDKVSKLNGLKVLVHHGPQRTKRFQDLAEYDVVITTYQILVSDHGASSSTDDGKKTGCFGLHWWRVVLDEAHTIKNRLAKSTKACYDLRSEYRWCLSGTPMQNNLDELQSLVRFLRIKPYDDIRQWKDHIDRPMKNGKGHIAISRLHSILRCFMKRRTKDILRLEGALIPGGKDALKAMPAGEEAPKPAFKPTERKVVTISCELSAAERQFYDRLEHRTDERVKAMMQEKISYASAFTMLLRLRQVCDHPKLVEGKLEKDKDAMTTDASQSQQSQDTDIDAMADLFSTMGIETKKCNVCSLELKKSQSDMGLDTCPECTEDMKLFQANGTSTKKSKKSKKSKKTAAAKSVRKQRNRNAVVDSDDEDDSEDSLESISALTQKMASQSLSSPGQSRRQRNRCVVDSSEDESESEDDDDDDDELQYGGAPIVPSAKIREMTRILHEEAHEHKFIIFSQFTSMLDLIEPFLRKAGFKYTRYDGSMKNDAREESLRQLRENKSVRVLLCSLKCGSLGLNLTAATRVIIIEPFWNPFVEEQAIDRVHRLTQTVDVVVYKLTAANTVEARIIDLQERKRLLAEQAIDNGSKKDALKLGLAELIDLFKPTAHAPTTQYHSTASYDDPVAAMEERAHSAVRMLERNSPVKKKAENGLYGRRW